MLELGYIKLRSSNIWQEIMNGLGLLFRLELLKEHLLALKLSIIKDLTVLHGSRLVYWKSNYSSNP